MENPTLAGRPLPWTFDEHPMIKASNSVTARCVNLRDQKSKIMKSISIKTLVIRIIYSRRIHTYGTCSSCRVGEK
jgi:hypothetical protein